VPVDTSAVILTPEWFSQYPTVTWILIASLWVFTFSVIMDVVTTVRSTKTYRAMTASHLTPHVPSNLKDFTAAFCPDQFRSTPGFPSAKIVRNRLRLIDEEVGELHRAVSYGDLVAVADALGDIQYVVEGAFLAFGIDSDAIHRAIHDSNMRKRQPNGSVQRDAGGKVIKPDGWTPPDLADVLNHQRKLRLRVARTTVKVVS
jgi:predicted HAD superfamily Cof-like phosphohydrolase